jgi:hypothetical protein
VKIDVQVCRSVAPILEYLTLLRRLRDRGSIVCPEPREQRQLLTAYEDVHRVDLDDAELLEDVDDMSLRGRRRSVDQAKTLRGTGKSTRFDDAQRIGAARHVE